ncbi:MAG: NAD(+) synthase, partial [Halobacteria archaeon]|nr:NAD(+) synthase [Halobacteria archaeon]
MAQLTESEFEPEGAVDTITDFIQSKVDEAGAEGVVVGLSGGIDSSTSSALAVEALGTENVSALVMPGETSDDENIRDAKEHAKAFGIEYEEVDISPIVDEYCDALPHAAEDEVAVGNVQARARMVLEYMEANARDYMVLGTGNRTELLIGYYTKYGDGGVDILPIGGLYKMEVREVARYLGVDETIIE